MLLFQKTVLTNDYDINLLIINEPIILYKNVKVICKDEDKNVKIMTFEEAKSRNLQIISKLSLHFEACMQLLPYIDRCKE